MIGEEQGERRKEKGERRNGVCGGN